MRWSRSCAARGAAHASARALLFEIDDGLAAGHGDLALDDRALGNGDAARRHPAADLRRGADLELFIDPHGTDDGAGNDPAARMHFALPPRTWPHITSAPGTSRSPVRRLPAAT